MTNQGLPEKEKIRRRMLELRRSLTKETCVQAAADMLSQIFSNAGSLCLEPGSVVAIFSPIRGEPDFYACRSAFFDRGLRICLPRVEEDQMNFYFVTPDEVLVPGAFGILEPESHCLPVPRGNLRVVLFPGLAFSRKGERIGYGAGYYDRYFARDNGADHAIRIGTAYDFQIMDQLPQDQDDARVDYLVTPDGFFPTL